MAVDTYGVVTTGMIYYEDNYNIRQLVHSDLLLATIQRIAVS